MRYHFPKKVSVFNAEHAVIHFEAGIQDVPEEFDNHWYFEACGAKPMDDDGNFIEPSEEGQEEEGEQVPPVSRKKRR